MAKLDEDTNLVVVLCKPIIPTKVSSTLATSFLRFHRFPMALKERSWNQLRGKTTWNGTCDGFDVS